MKRALCGGGTAARQSRSRLHLEVLEGRCLPSTVTNLTDHDPGSLRDAIAMTPSGGTVDFQPELSGTIVLTSGELAVNKDLTITGPGASMITVSGNHAGQVFNIANVTVAISGLIIADSTVLSQDGGGIYNAGTLSITGSVFSNNSAFYGGAIYNAGTLTVSGSTFSGNSAGSGGAIDNDFTLTIIASTFSHNSARGGGLGGAIQNAGNRGTLAVVACTFSGNSGGLGGAVVNQGYAALVVTGCTFSDNFAGNGSAIESLSGRVTVATSTFSGNSATFAGGGIENQGALMVTGCTFSQNTTKGTGGGIVNVGTLIVISSTFSGNSGGFGGGIATFPYSPAVLIIRNTLLAENTTRSHGPDVDGPLVSQGHNLIGDGSSASGYVSTDLVGTSASPIDPKLGPLQDNGGPTPTMALLSGSPALDAGALTDSEWDQRGPGYSRLVNGATDIGAYEVQQPGTGAGARPPVLRERTILVPETIHSQPAAPVWPPGVPSAPRVPVRPAVAPVDQVFASWSSESAYWYGCRSQQVSPADGGSWPVDLVLAEESL